MPRGTAPVYMIALASDGIYSSSGQNQRGKNAFQQSANTNSAMNLLPELFRERPQLAFIVGIVAVVAIVALWMVYLNNRRRNKP